MIPSLVENPFAALSFIAAPAVLTNSVSLLALSTSNRFLRSGERLRVAIKELEVSTDSEHREFWLKHMSRIERQAHHLLVGLRWIYIALGSFVGMTMISVLGAVLIQWNRNSNATDTFASSPWVLLFIVITLGFGFVGTYGIIAGCISLFSATRLALKNIHEEAQRGRQKSLQFLENLSKTE